MKSKQNIEQEQQKHINTAAFNEIYKAHWEPLFVFAYKISKSRELSQDIVQDVFFSLWKRLPLDTVENIGPYLFQSVKYQIYSAYKNNKFQTEPLKQDFENYLVESLEEERPDKLKEVMELLERLPEKRKEILLSKFQGLSNQEIAEEFNLSSQTVKNQLGKAFKSLRDGLPKTSLLFVLFQTL